MHRASLSGFVYVYLTAGDEVDVHLLTDHNGTLCAPSHCAHLVNLHIRAGFLKRSCRKLITTSYARCLAGERIVCLVPQGRD